MSILKVKKPSQTASWIFGDDVQETENSSTEDRYSGLPAGCDDPLSYFVGTKVDLHSSWYFEEESRKTLPTPEDRQLASEIRDYYMDRHTVRKLCGDYTSEYSDKMASALLVRGKIYEKYTGIYYTLEQFYHEDLELDKLCESRKWLDPEPHKFLGDVVVNLTPLYFSSVKRKYSHPHALWACDDEGYLFKLSDNSTLNNFLEFLSKQKKFQICIQGQNVRNVPLRDTKMINVSGYSIISVG